MDSDFVRDVLVELLTAGKRFSTSDVVLACANKQGVAQEEMAKYWDDIRACVREMREEFLDAEEFCDSYGMPHGIQMYTRSKVEVPFCHEEVNVYHPAGWHTIGYEFPEFESAPESITEEEAEEKLGKIMQTITSQPQKIVSLKREADGSLVLPPELVDRIGNLDNPDTIAQLLIGMGMFGEYDVYG